MPDGDVLAIEFILSEIERLNAFLKRHKELYDYYKRGETDNDPKWFIKTKSKNSQLLGKLIAIEKYIEFLQGRISAIGK